jgi:5-methylcytosine-specific restriction enzyme subunit McrC
MNKNRITVFEHDTLKLGKSGNRLSEEQLKALQGFYGDKGVSYYKLIHNGIQFNEYVGVIQVGNLIIEVLPKADRYKQKSEWQKILIGMLKAVHAFNVKAPSSSSLNIKTNFVLDLYFELFIKEVEYLFKKGLVKKYRKNEGNCFALKGNILFGKQIQKNLVHKERFYVRYTNYDKEHLLHQIIRKTLLLLKFINTNTALYSRIGNLLLNFPELKDIKVTESTFHKISYNQKTEEYKNAIEISRLLLLNFHPDINKGQNHVLALMFDMNLLWERFIYVSLRRHLKKNMKITAQKSKYFWKPEKGNNSRIKPDILINFENKNFILDTKWKNIENKNPSPDDLRQLYVYHEYYNAQKVALVYPGEDSLNSGNYYKTDNRDLSDKTCSIIKIKTNSTITEWQNHIANCLIYKWINPQET